MATTTTAADSSKSQSGGGGAQSSKKSRGKGRSKNKKKDHLQSDKKKGKQQVSSAPAYAWSSFQNSPEPEELPVPSFAAEIFVGGEDVGAMSQQLRSLLGVG